jgi:hypothetical protein
VEEASISEVEDVLEMIVIIKDTTPRLTATVQSCTVCYLASESN